LEEVNENRSTNSKASLEKEKFIPYLNERSVNGRINIESVRNLVTKVG
jgi:hypothetical protein